MNSSSRIDCIAGEIVITKWLMLGCPEGKWKHIRRFKADSCDWDTEEQEYIYHDTKGVCATKTIRFESNVTEAASNVTAGLMEKTVAPAAPTLLDASFIKEVTEAHNNYLEGNCGGGDPNNLNWEMSSAIFFIITIVTTIGYGTFAPATDAGKVFTVVFAFIGIVYFGMVLGMVGDVLVVLIKDGSKFLCHRKQKNFKLTGKMTLLYASIIMVVYIMVIGAGCMSIGWGAGDGMYCEFFLVAFADRACDADALTTPAPSHPNPPPCSHMQSL